MKKLLFSSIVLFSLFFLSNQITLPDDLKAYIKNLSDNELKSFISSGSLAGYWKVEEVFTYLDTLASQVNEFQKSAISTGKTYQGREIPLYKISSTENSSRNNKYFFFQKTDKSSLLFITAAHAREFATYHLGIYHITFLVRGILNGNLSVLEILNNFDIYFIPIANIDSVNEIQIEILDRINKKKNPYDVTSQIRKNRNNDPTIFPKVKLTEKQLREGIGYGVDINRNYGFSWGYDDKGSSPRPLDETYRGPSPFSESETRNIRDVVDNIKNNSNMKFVMDIHAYGNMFLIPESPKIHTLEDYRNNYPLQYRQFKEIIARGNFPADLKIGTPSETVGYMANGDSMQNFFFGQGILASAFELGSGNPHSRTFFPTPELITHDIIPHNITPIYFTLKTFFYNLSLNKIKYSLNQVSSTEFQYLSNLKIINVGHIKYDSDKSKVYINLSITKLIPLKSGVVTLNNNKYQINITQRTLKILIDTSILSDDSITLDILITTAAKLPVTTDLYQLNVESDVFKDNTSSDDLSYSYGNIYLNNDKLATKGSDFN